MIPVKVSRHQGKGVKKEFDIPKRCCDTKAKGIILESDAHEGVATLKRRSAIPIKVSLPCQRSRRGSPIPAKVSYSCLKESDAR